MPLQEEKHELVQTLRSVLFLFVFDFSLLDEIANLSYSWLQLASKKQLSASLLSVYSTDFRWVLGANKSSNLR